MTIKMNWKIVASLDRAVSSKGDISTVAFNAQPSPRIFSQFAFPLEHAYVPLALRPTATYYQMLRNRLKPSDKSFWIGRLPFEVHTEQLGQTTVNFKLRIYPPNIVVMTVSLHAAIDIALDANYGQLVELRSAEVIPDVADLVRFTLGVVNSGNHKQPRNPRNIRAFPAYHLTPVNKSSEVSAYISDHARMLTALLLGIKNPISIAEDLVGTTLKHSAELNKKSSEELLLLNKQGIVFLTPAEKRQLSEPDRFGRAGDLAELGLVTQRFLDTYLTARRMEEDFADYILIQARAWIRRPTAIFAASFTNRLAWGIFSEAFRLEDKLSLIEQLHDSTLREAETKLPVFTATSTQWWEREEFARTFDGIAGNSSGLLSKITDADLRVSILEDLREAEMCYNSRNLKAAVVMSGAAVEAMLLALLEQSNINSANSLRDKGLHEYVDLVKSAGLLKDIAMLDLLDNSLRKWRNLVHPGRSLRTGVVLAEHHASISVSAAKALASALS